MVRFRVLTLTLTLTLTLITVQVGRVAGYRYACERDGFRWVKSCEVDQTLGLGMMIGPSALVRDRDEPGHWARVMLNIKAKSALRFTMFLGLELELNRSVSHS